ncbi:MAG: LemA family protein [Bdellovibrionales bacterium]|nr:LemA family protein [Bdellovibrionales bacterium]
MEPGWFIFFLGTLIAFAAMYNSLIRKRNEVENAVGAVHTFLQNRADLIPSLVTTIQQFTKHEADLIAKVTQARESIQKNLQGDQNLAEADKMISNVVGRIVAVVENYPELKSSQNFLQLQAALNEIEGQLSAARRTYNSAVTLYNSAVDTLPTNVVASVVGFKRKAVYQVSVETAAKPDLQKLFSKTGS